MGDTDPLSMVVMFYRDSQRPSLIRWKWKENTVTPNHGHSNQGQQRTHVFTTVPFQGDYLSFQNSVCKTSSTLSPGVSKPEAAPPVYTSEQGHFKECESCVRILTFLTRIHVSPVRGERMATWLHVAMVKWAGWRRRGGHWNKDHTLVNCNFISRLTYFLFNANYSTS